MGVIKRLGVFAFADIKTRNGFALSAIKTINGLDATSGGFVPSDIAGLQVWLEADSLSLGDGDPVSTWADQSGNGNDATGSGTARPTYQTNELNSLPIVRFDGVNDVLAGNRGSLTGYTLFLIFKGNPPTNFTGPYVLENDSHDGIYVGNLFVRVSTNINSGDNFSSFKLLSLTCPGSGTATAYVNGASAGTNSGAAPGGSGYLLGTASNSTFSPVDIAAFLIYDSSLGSTDRGAVETYLINKWAL